MALVNEHFLKLPGNYLFADIAKKVNAYKIAHPKQRVISLGIGDVTQPLCPAVIQAMHKAVEEMAVQASFRGYGPERGYDFLREAIIKNDFLPRGIHLDVNEVFVNDGAKSDTGNIQEILRWDNNIGVTDPIYPVYIDSNVMIGRAGVFENGHWSNVVYMPCNEGNDFTPQIPDHRVDMIYLCYPNNPTGTVITKDELRKWVNYAIKNESIILYDAAYEAYITDPEIPHSIYEIRGAHLGPSPVHQVQWYQLHQSARSRSHLHPRGQGAGEGHHRLLYGERPLHAGRASAPRFQRLRRRECTLSLGEDPWQHPQLEVLRRDALWSQRGVHPGRRIRSFGRRLHPSHCLWRA